MRVSFDESLTMKPAELLGMKNAERDHLKFGFKKKKEEEASAASQLVTPEQPDRPTNMPLHPRARAQHHHTGLHETRTARFTQNAVSK